MTESLVNYTGVPASGESAANNMKPTFTGRKKRMNPKKAAMMEAAKSIKKACSR